MLDLAFKDISSKFLKAVDLKKLTFTPFVMRWLFNSADSTKFRRFFSNLENNRLPVIPGDITRECKSLETL